MLEKNDINDSEVLSKSTMEKDGKGNIKFKFSLPSGKTLTSEWVRPEDQKKAMMIWCDQVKTNIIADIEDTRREQAQAHKKAVQAADVVPEVRNAVSSPQVSSDPLTFAQEQVKLLSIEVDHWTSELHRATKNLQSASEALGKWQTIIASLEASGEEK